MISTLRSAETLRKVGPMELAAYLRSHAWKHVESIGDKATVWTKPAPKKEEYEVLVLLDRTLSEYPRRMSEALHTLAVAEDRDELLVFRDITTTSSDIVRVRLEHGLIEHGTIPFEYGVRMVNEARDALFAAACATVRPRALYQSRKPQNAIDYVNGLRMGQTEEGSFVLAIQSPVTPLLRQDPELLETREEEPFERRVLLTLSDSLAAVKQAVTSACTSGDFKPFQDAVALGVSANLCDALVGLSMDNTAEDVTFQISWSPTRYVTDKIPNRFRFGRDAFPVLREAAHLLRLSAPIEDFSLLGTVTSLRREDFATTGRVTVNALIENVWRKVRMELADREYHMAGRAHDEKEFISCVGELVKQQRTYYLLNVRDFTILEYPDVDMLDEDNRMDIPANASGGSPPYHPDDADDADPFADE